MPEKIFIASDHAGFELKKAITEYVTAMGDYDIEDLGTDSADRVDYPDFAKKACNMLLKTKNTRARLPPRRRP